MRQLIALFVGLVVAACSSTSAPDEQVGTVHADLFAGDPPPPTTKTLTDCYNEAVACGAPAVRICLIG
jgi:hypothetical protein